MAAGWFEMMGESRAGSRRDIADRTLGVNRELDYLSVN